MEIVKELRFEVNIDDASNLLNCEQIAAVIKAILVHELNHPLRVEQYGKLKVQAVVPR